MKQWRKTGKRLRGYAIHDFCEITCYPAPITTPHQERESSPVEKCPRVIAYHATQQAGMIQS